MCYISKQGHRQSETAASQEILSNPPPPPCTTLPRAVWKASQHKGQTVKALPPGLGPSFNSHYGGHCRQGEEKKGNRQQMQSKTKGRRRSKEGKRTPGGHWSFIKTHWWIHQHKGIPIIFSRGAMKKMVSQQKMLFFGLTRNTWIRRPDSGRRPFLNTTPADCDFQQFRMVATRRHCLVEIFDLPTIRSLKVSYQKSSVSLETHKAIQAKRLEYIGDLWPPFGLFRSKLSTQTTSKQTFSYDLSTNRILMALGWTTLLWLVGFSLITNFFKVFWNFDNKEREGEGKIDGKGFHWENNDRNASDLIVNGDSCSFVHRQVLFTFIEKMFPFKKIYQQLKYDGQWHWCWCSFAYNLNTDIWTLLFASSIRLLR